jgi:hypothetical protein
MFDDVREDIKGFFKSKEGCERIKILNPSYFNELCEFLIDGNNKKFTFFYEEALFFPPNAVDSLILRMVFKDNFLKENGLFKKALNGEKQRLKNIKAYQMAEEFKLDDQKTEGEKKAERIQREQKEMMDDEGFSQYVEGLRGDIRNRLESNEGIERQKILNPKILKEVRAFAYEGAEFYNSEVQCDWDRPIDS